MRQLRILLPLLLALLLGLSSGGRPSQAREGRGQPAQAGEELCFPETRQCISGELRLYWEQNGGLPVFGYPTTSARQEVNRDTGAGYLTQWFERARFELHPENAAPYNVLMGRLGNDRLLQAGIDWQALEPEPGPREGCLWFAETRHNVCNQQGELGFLSYWREHGLRDPALDAYRRSLALFGLPLTTPKLETNPSGDTVLTQWFERARFEWHPDKPDQHKVLLGLLGKEVRSADGPVAPAPGFVGVQGDRLVQNGQPIMLRGVNYYPATDPWAEMWRRWDGHAIDRELGRARRELEINSIRVLVPYEKNSDWTDGLGNVQPDMLNRLRELLQIAGTNGIKVIVTLFDWHDPMAKPYSPLEENNLRYLRTIVEAFKDDDRVLAWDIHNEPDNYAAWGDTGRDVVGWLDRMATAIKTIDQRHLVTVGGVRLENYWVQAPNGRTIVDISDFISVHSYYLPELEQRLSELRRRTSKPIVLEEFGWPSGPACRTLYWDEQRNIKLAYDEPSQRRAYEEQIKIALRYGVTGMLSWWFQDLPYTDPHSVDEQGFFGLYRSDGQRKLAAEAFRAVKVPALPSLTKTSLPLTVVPGPDTSPTDPPMIFEDGIVLRDAFKHLWTRFGGQDFFGKPLTQMHRNHEGNVVQFFERAVMQLNEDENLPYVDFAYPQPLEVHLKYVWLTPLGQRAAEGKAFARVGNPGQAGVRYFESTGHTLRGEFLKVWERYGELYFGPPLSEEVDEVIDGHTVRVQYFTFWRFERNAAGGVHFSSLGAEALRTRFCPTE